MSAAPETYAVQLAIYDLSNGMASSLSRQFLGPDHAIDIIPHSAVLAYGREYYFGSGIYNVSPEEFRVTRGIQPIMILNSGQTTSSREQFERWCHEVASREYSSTSYNLLGRNCNNFADYALRDGLGMPDGVPQWVLEVPQRFLSSPLGQMVRPMLENMHTNFAGRNGGAQPMNFAPPFSQPTANPMPAASTANPWADIPSSSSSASAQPKPQAKNHTPLLDNNHSYLLSTNTAMLPTCMDKLIKHTQLHKQDAQTTALQQLKQHLTQSQPLCTTSTLEQALWPFFSTTNDKVPNTILTNALLLLRIVVLKPLTHSNKFDVKTFLSVVASKLEQGQSTSAAVHSLSWCVLSNAVGSTQAEFSSFFDSSSSSSSASSSLEEPPQPSLESIVDMALSQLSSPTTTTTPTTTTKEVRQAAAAFLYNITHKLTELSDPSLPTNNPREEDAHMPDVIVTILCGALDGCQEEATSTTTTTTTTQGSQNGDDVTMFRRLLIVARVLQKYGALASTLVKELGYDDALQRLANSKQEKEENGALAAEVCSLLLS